MRPEFDAEFAYHFGIPKPIIAAVNGPAAGVGFALACYCDLRFAAAGAKLTTAHGRLGLPAEFGLSWLVPRLVGLTRAADILLSSRVLLAEEAAEIGLVNTVTPGDELLATVHRYARMLATEVSPASLAATKLQLYTDLHRDAATSARHAEERLRAMMTGPDFEEGVAALAAHRPPRFADPPGRRWVRCQPCRSGGGRARRWRRVCSTRSCTRPTLTRSTPGCGPRRRWRGTRSEASGPSPGTRDVSVIENDHDTFCAGRGILVEEIGTTYASPPTMMHSDPPVHTRYRRLVQPAFKPRSCAPSSP